MKLSSLYTTSNLPYVRLTDTKASGTAGTTYNGGAYRTITLNTEEQDVDGVCSLSSNQFTLAAGKYALRIVTGHEYADSNSTLRIRNITDASTVIKWPKYNQRVDGSTQGMIPVDHEGQFSIAGSKALELQIFTSQNFTPTARSDGESEIYWVVDLVKLD
jgi:hypothetical protein